MCCFGLEIPDLVLVIHIKKLSWRLSFSFFPQILPEDLVYIM